MHKGIRYRLWIINKVCEDSANVDKNSHFYGCSSWIDALLFLIINIYRLKYWSI